MRRFIIIAMLLSFTVSCGGASPRPTLPGTTAVPLVTFVFDDGNDTDYLVAKDVFAEQGAVACSAVTTDWINTKDHLTPAQIISLRDAGWEIMSHTVSHPNLRSMTPVQVEDEFSCSKFALENLGLTVKNLVYPYNKNNEMVREIARKYYRSGRGGTNAVNTLNTDPYYLKSYSNKHDLAGMERYIDRAYADRSWIIFYHHQIDIKVDLADKNGSFIPGEKLLFSPSGAIGRYETARWFLFFGSLYFVPLSGPPRSGDTVTGEMSGATARIDRLLYDERAQISEMIRYVRTRYPEMRIVTIDQGLDILGMPGREAMEKTPGEPMNAGCGRMRKL